MAQDHHYRVSSETIAQRAQHCQAVTMKLIEILHVISSSAGDRVEVADAIVSASHAYMSFARIAEKAADFDPPSDDG